jgi:uncharacterized protein YbaR (Trm112 family)
MLNKELLEIIACPKCGKELVLSETNDALICNNDNEYYPIIDGIPMLLAEEAKPI